MKLKIQQWQWQLPWQWQWQWQWQSLPGRWRSGVYCTGTKTEVFTWEGGLPERTPEGLTLAGDEVNGSLEHPFILYESPVGSPVYVRHKL